MTNEQLIAAAESQNLESLFADAYEKMYDDDCENIRLLLYYDYDEKTFAFKDDAFGQYRHAFEQQNNVKTLGYVDTNTAFSRSLPEVVEMYFSQSQV